MVVTYENSWNLVRSDLCASASATLQRSSAYSLKLNLRHTSDIKSSLEFFESNSNQALLWSCHHLLQLYSICQC